ncbi:neurogenic locus notch -like protein [Brachionus plicatilis]|uniref:Neurogenic locus notch-like protein n=1 Tax=Brachionus plicatilis TaxID=10195 RepID=A0A3M7QBS0_BRAPC|nr:neurogenic locus notch -like protein [Brachionus plicatilis]
MMIKEKRESNTVNQFVFVVTHMENTIRMKSSKILYGDTNMTSLINSTNKSFSFERIITIPGAFGFRVDVNDLNIYALENINVTGFSNCILYLNLLTYKGYRLALKNLNQYWIENTLSELKGQCEILVQKLQYKNVFTFCTVIFVLKFYIAAERGRIFVHFILEIHNTKNRMKHKMIQSVLSRLIPNQIHTYFTYIYCSLLIFMFYTFLITNFPTLITKLFQSFVQSSNYPSLFLSLKSKYCLSSRYKQVSGFFEDFGILRERYMNDSDINSIVIESFEVNISNKGSRQKPKRKCFSGSSFNRHNLDTLIRILNLSSQFSNKDANLIIFIKIIIRLIEKLNFHINSKITERSSQFLILLNDCPTVVKKGEQFNFSIEFYGFEQNVTISFGDLTSITIENPNGLKFSSKMFIHKTYDKFGHYKIFAYDAFKMFNSTCYIKLDGSTLDLNDLNSVVYLLDKKLDLNDCLNNCSGNGICRQLTDNFFKCSCFEDFEGNSCQTSKHKCFRKPCLNNGICNETKVISSLTDHVNYEYECICSDRFYGTHCEKMKKDYCTNKTCSGNGICFFNQTSEQGECKCFPLYGGNFCQIESSEMKTIRKVISTATIIAIITIFLLFSTIIILDILTIFTKKKSNKVAPKEKIEA